MQNPANVFRYVQQQQCHLFFKPPNDVVSNMILNWMGMMPSQSASHTKHATCVGIYSHESMFLCYCWSGMPLATWMVLRIIGAKWIITQCVCAVMPGLLKCPTSSNGILGPAVNGSPAKPPLLLLSTPLGASAC